MKILFAARFTPDSHRPIGGVQTWITTVRAALEKRGHECATWAPRQDDPDTVFDAGVFAHIRHTRRQMKRCSRALLLSHGIIRSEYPANGYNTAYTSEEVRDFWTARNSSDGPIIRQPIDLAFWSPGRSETRCLHHNTLVHYGYGAPIPNHEEAARRLGMKSLHLKGGTLTDIRDFLRQASVVFASGRAACEAMACGAATVICDHRSAYQPPLLDRNIETAILRNYSGRGGEYPTTDLLIKAVQEARARGAEWFRAHAERHHCADEVADELLSLLESDEIRRKPRRALGGIFGAC